MTFPRSCLIFVAGLLLASACPGGGLKSSACEAYFEKAEQCAAKATPTEAEMIRGVARLAREGFERNSNLPRVEESCKQMLKTLGKEPACQ